MREPALWEGVDHSGIEMSHKETHRQRHHCDLWSCTNLLIKAGSWRGRGGGGWESPMKMTGVLVIPSKGYNLSIGTA